MPRQRLDKRLAHATGLARKHARSAIRDGRVTVNRAKVIDPGALVTDERVTLDGEPIDTPMDIAVFHKAVGVQCTVGDPMGRRSLQEAASDLLAEGLHPVGRLDADTSGLLLFCRDGQLTQRLLHPRHAVEKTYRATVEGTPTAALRDVLAAGVTTAHGVHTARVDRIDGATVTLTITMGKHRIVRRLLANAGFPVLALHRERLGAFALGDLAASEWREPSEAERAWATVLVIA